MMMFILIVLSAVSSQASSHDWIPGYLDKNGILHTFRNKDRSQQTSGTETNTEKILLRIRFRQNKTLNRPEVTRRHVNGWVLPGSMTEYLFYHLLVKSR